MEIGIQVTDYNRPALTDFDISGTMNSVQSDGGGISIPWSPPESFGDGATDGVIVDIWALGATIYTLLAGHSPFVIPGADNSKRMLIDRMATATLPRLGGAGVPRTGSCLGHGEVAIFPLQLRQGPRILLLQWKSGGLVSAREQRGRPSAGLGAIVAGRVSVPDYLFAIFPSALSVPECL